MITAEFDADDLLAALERVDEELDTTLGLVAMQAGDMVVAEAKANHDYRDGPTASLTNSIGPPVVTGSWRGGDLSVAVAAGAPHAAAIEFGARPHKIRPRYRRALRWPVEGGFRFATEVNHPGNRPYRYLRNALEKKLPTIILEVQAAVDLAFARAGLE